MSLVRLGNVGSNCLLLLLLISILHDVQSSKPRNTANFIQSMNPIVRYRFTSHIKNRLQQLDTKERQEPNRNSRNCFFSPVQCHLPVEVVGQQRPESLYVGLNKFRKRLALPFFKSTGFNDLDV